MSDQARALEGDRFTQQDVTLLNRASVERAAWFARTVAGVLIGAGVFLAVSWIWVSIRTQQRLSATGVSASTAMRSFDSPSPPILDRLDAFAGTVGLLTGAAVVTGLGFLMRLAADYCQSRVGGSTSGFAVGDVIPPEDSSGV